MGVDCGEVEPSGYEEDHGFHRLEAGVSTRLALGGLKEAVNGFDEAIGLTGLGPSGDAIEMSADHDGDVLHGVDLGAQHMVHRFFSMVDTTLICLRSRMSRNCSR